ncbi:MAG: hypothetical protein ABIM50_13825 [Novosphingobium sp.]
MARLPCVSEEDMATAKPPALPRQRQPSRLAPRRPKWRTWLALTVLACVLLLAWFWKPLNGYAVAGASYGARVACSCRFIGGRNLQDCRKDFVSGMGLARLSEDAKAKSVTATFPLLSRQTATFREGEGCVLEKWPD